MYYSKIRNNDIANGNGIRVTLFVSGCRNHCEGCFQPETWDFNYGIPFTQNTIEKIINLLKPNYINGLTLLGGEPMEKENQPYVVQLAREVRKIYGNTKTIWCYTGYSLENLMRDNSNVWTQWTDELLSHIDVLVDGQFDKDKRDVSLSWRGSTNQRVIDMKKTLQSGNVVLEQVRK